MSNARCRVSAISQRIVIIGGGSRAAQAFQQFAQTHGVPLRIILRSEPDRFGPDAISIPDYFNPPDNAFAGSTVAINFVGITHGKNSALLDTVNGQGPVRIAAIAKACGIKHFIQLSSFKVYGDAREITRRTAEVPDTRYGRSKLKADKELRALASDNFTVTILRLPLLYGGGTGDNLKRLGALMVRLGFLPIPRRSIERSVLHVDNLAMILMELVLAPVNGTVIACDEEPFTHSALAETLGLATGRTPRLLSLPDIAFAPMRLFLPGLYNRIYESKFAPRSECFVPPKPLPVSLKVGLAEIFGIKHLEDRNRGRF